jgi:two-component system NtrC family response regulator
VEKPARPAPLFVVEDEQSIIDMLIEYFSTRGYAVSSTDSGTGCMERIWELESGTVVLLDINIPGMGGIEVLKELKEHRPEIMVIMLTSVNDRQIAKSAMKLGAFDYVLKPPNLADLEAVIRAAISTAEYRQGSGSDVD